MSDEVRATPRESGLREDDEISEVWREFKSTADGHLRNRLIERYLYLVKVIANRIAARLPRSIDVQDLRSAGVFGLIRAIENFDTSRGTRFESYCATRVHGAILDELRAQDWVPRAVRGRMHVIDRATERFEQENGGEPDLDEIAEATGLDRAEVRSTLVAYQSGYLASLDERLDGDTGGEDEPRGRQFVDPTAELPEEVYDHEESQRLVRESIRSLKQRDRAVIALYYYEELTFAEIGRVLGVSESRACQMHGRAIKELGRVS
jgi:RNA polymerase sigma factor for flagellar operon FliA